MWCRPRHGADSRRARSYPFHLPRAFASPTGANRKLWLPGGLLDFSDVNPVLDGTEAGDYGLDPFNLSKTVRTDSRGGVGAPAGEGEGAMIARDERAAPRAHTSPARAC